MAVTSGASSGGASSGGASSGGASVPDHRWPKARSAYIHVPFCRHRCGYCNFTVIAGRDDLVERFLGAIDTELAALDRPQVDTLFIGGGTPTHLDDDQLTILLRCIQSRFRLTEDCEWSVEANPEDIHRDLLVRLVEHGVNRISLGIQSFDDEKLRRLERGHSGGFARRAVEMAAAEIENVSIDLIFGAPGERVADWERDLEIALSLPLAHLSTYALTYEKGSRFWSRRERGELHSPQESADIAMYQLAREMTSAFGLEQYEISSFAFPNRRCRHNLSYWSGRGWYGAGPGAARFIGGRRETNHRSTTSYLRKIEQGQSPTAESESLSLDEYACERVAFGVRMIDGIDLDQIRRETGVDMIEKHADAWKQLVSQGLVQVQQNHVRLTQRGILLADTVASTFLG